MRLPDLPLGNRGLDGVKRPLQELRGLLLALDLGQIGPEIDIVAVADGVYRPDLFRKAAAAIGQALFNRLEEPALPLLPLLAQLKQQLTALAASQPILGHQMSGSGSTYFVLCPTLVAAQQVAAAVRALGDQPRGQDDPGFSLLVVRSRRPRN